MDNCKESNLSLSGKFCAGSIGIGVRQFSVTQFCFSDFWNWIQKDETSFKILNHFETSFKILKLILVSKHD